MHEFSTVQTVFNELEKNPRNIKVKLGSMRANKDVFLNTLKEMTRDTDLKDLNIEVEEIKVIGKCTCSFEGEIEVPGHVHFVRCPECSSICDILQGNELIIEDL